MTNEAVGDRNKREKETGKTHFMGEVLKNEFWKCIGCIILEDIYGNK